MVRSSLQHRLTRQSDRSDNPYEIAPQKLRRRLDQQIGNSGDIGFGFDFGAEDSGKLAAKICIGAGMAHDSGTDNSSKVPSSFLPSGFV